MNEEIREEARKMSEYVVEDTKRTVEMLNWLKGQSKSNNNVADSAIALGASIVTGNISQGVAVIANTILPRLRDRIVKPQVAEPQISVPNLKAIECVRHANQMVLTMRKLITEESFNSHDLDDICYDIQVLLGDIESIL